MAGPENLVYSEKGLLSTGDWVREVIVATGAVQPDIEIVDGARKTLAIDGYVVHGFRKGVVGG